MPKSSNDPIKIAFPMHNSNQQTAPQQQQHQQVLHHQQQQQQQHPQFQQQQQRTILNNRAPQNNMNSGNQTGTAGNRITFTSQSLPNGTINIGTPQSHQQGATILQTVSTAQLPNTTTIKTITAAGQQLHHHQVQQQQQQQQHHVLQQQQQQQHNAQSVGATQTQTLGNQQNMIGTSMIPANVVVGMRPPGQNQQKNLNSGTMGRVVIGGPHMVGTRPNSPAITLSALHSQPGQTPALILKTENGFQLLRVGTATSGPVTQTIGTNSTNPTQIRLQTVPAAVSRFTGPQIALRKTIVRSTTTTTQQQQAKQKQNVIR